MEEGSVENVQEIKNLCQKLVDPKMKFCPGIPIEEYESYKEAIRYDQKRCTLPLNRSNAFLL